MKLGVVSQTPVVRFLNKVRKDPVRLAELNKEHYTYTVGGVAPLVFAELQQLIRNRLISKAYWYSLNPDAPSNVIIAKNINVINIWLEKESSKYYTDFKQCIWNNIHNISTEEFTTKEYLGYFRYNSRLVKTMLQNEEPIDIFEVHDFQQLLLGGMLGPTCPSVFRWHIPFIPENLAPKIRKFIINGMEGNDSVIVSTKRDLEGLIRSGYKGSAYQLYPHIDPTVFTRPTRTEVNSFSEKYGIKEDDFLVLNVARMDSIKSQDDLIKAMALIKDRSVKLMLIGNGSFTSTSLGHSKAYAWRTYLEKLARKLKLQGRVIFTGYVPAEQLRGAYERADLFVLPSRMEGFGLVAVESWLYDTPTIVSSGSGVSELVVEDLNGLTFRAGDFRELAKKITRFRDDDALRESSGINAHRMARACFVSTTLPMLRSIYEKTIESFG